MCKKDKEIFVGSFFCTKFCSFYTMCVCVHACVLQSFTTHVIREEYICIKEKENERKMLFKYVEYIWTARHPRENFFFKTGAKALPQSIN
jgi:hypothetical protein